MTTIKKKSSFVRAKNYTPVRRKIKLLFIEKYKHLFESLYNKCAHLGERRYLTWCRCPEMKELAELARKEIGYNKSTGNADIVYNMYWNYKQIYKTGLW